jgi:hypothetical protein
MAWLNALRDDHARRYAGTLDMAFPDRRHIFFYVRIKPALGVEA